MARKKNNNKPNIESSVCNPNGELRDLIPWLQNTLHRKAGGILMEAATVTFLLYRKGVHNT